MLLQSNPVSCCRIKPVAVEAHAIEGGTQLDVGAFGSIETAYFHGSKVAVKYVKPGTGRVLTPLHFLSFRFLTSRLLHEYEITMQPEHKDMKHLKTIVGILSLDMQSIDYDCFIGFKEVTW